MYISNPCVGFVAPDCFIEYFSSKIPTAPLLYRGQATPEFIQSVKQGTLKNMSFEGVVCKSVQRDPTTKSKEIIRFKVKNRAWIDSLKDHCQGDTALFNTLL